MRSLTVKSWAPSLLTSAVALLIALVAGCDNTFYESPAFFANATREPVNIRVRRLRAEVDCARTIGRTAEALADRDLYTSGESYLVEPGQALPMGPSIWSQGPRGCAAIMQLLGFPDQLVSWPGTSWATTESQLASLADPRFQRVSLRLEGHRDVLGLAVGEDLEITALPPAESAKPPFAGSPATLGWSGGIWPGELQVLRREMLPDGCLSLELGSSSSSLMKLYLCVPSWGFPFEVGQHVKASESVLPITRRSHAEPQINARHLVVEASPGSLPKLDLWLNAEQGQVPEVNDVLELGTLGRHTSCGAYADPLAVTLDGSDTPLEAGQESESISSGVRTRALLGRADLMIVAPADCGDDYAALGSRIDLLLVQTLENSP